VVPTDPTSAHGWWQWFTGIPLTVLLTVVVSGLVLVVLRVVIHRVTDGIASGARRAGGTGTLTGLLARANPLVSERRAQRARTLGSVLQSTASIVVTSIAVLLILDDLGVNIAPFIASAGVVGVALGFGAQSLVKDFLSGTFMLLEDQYGVGDTVDFGTVTGKVEEVALRVTKVRDAAGTLWYLRNGEILRVGNQTQEWANAVVRVVVGADSGVDVVHDALERAADSVARDPVLGGSMLEPPEVSDGDALTSDGLGFTVHVKTRPAMQWDVQRALRLAVRDELATVEVALVSA
jgi:small conductance mechanosensitive channel